MPNKATAEGKALCRTLIADPAYLARFTRAFVRRRLPYRLEQMVWAYAWGKPQQSVELKGRITLEELVAGANALPPEAGA